MARTIPTGRGGAKGPPGANGTSGLSATLAQVLANGNTTGAHTIDTGEGVIDGTGPIFALTAAVIGGVGQAVTLSAGTSPAASGFSGGNASVDGGDGDTQGGDASLYGGYGHAGNAAGGVIQSKGGSTDGTGGAANLNGGNAEAGSSKAGGDITLTPGAGDGAGRNGLFFPNLPTVDPGVSGAAWNNAGIVTISP